MLNFLNTTILFAAAAALIPLVIHLFSRRKVRIVEFSSLKHLKAMQRRQVRRLKVRQLLLLLLRMLIILAAVLAFARPTSEGGAVGAHASVSAVILFDNSASMNQYVTDGNLFELARRKTGDLLDGFGESDQVALIPLADDDQSRERIEFVSAATAAEYLSRLPVSYLPADFSAGLDKAAALLGRAINLNKEVYIVTDRQRHNLPDSAYLAASEAVVYLLDLPVGSTENVGLTEVDLGGQLVLPGHDFTVTAGVRNFGAEDRDDIIASLFVDGRRVSQTALDVKAGDETTVRFAHAVPSTGFHAGRIELSDDRYIEDNQYFFSFHIPEQFNLLIVNGDQTGELLRLALSPAAGINQYWSVKMATPQQLEGVNLYDYDVVMLAGAPVLEETYFQRLRQFVDRGRSLFVTLDGAGDTAYFNARYAEITGLNISQAARQDFTRAGYYTIASFDVDHPVFSVFAFEQNRPPEIKFYTLPRAELRSSARALMQFSGDRPALVEYRFGLGRVMTLTGPIAPRFGDLAGHAFFVPFVSRIAEYLAADLSSFDVSLSCGDNISRSLSLKTSVQSALDLITPDSGVYALAPEERQGALVVRVKPADRPGVYSIRLQGREIDRFALNVNRVESDLSPVDPDQLGRAVGTEDLKLLDSQVNLAATIAQFRFGKEYWQIFLWLAVLLILAEILLSRSAGAREPE